MNAYEKIRAALEIADRKTDVLTPASAYMTTGLRERPTCEGSANQVAP